MTEDEFKTGVAETPGPLDPNGTPLEGAAPESSGVRNSTPEEIAANGPLERCDVPEGPETTPDGEEERDPDTEDDGEETGPEAPVDETPQVHTLTVSREKTHTVLTMRFFHEAEGWVTRRCTLAYDATAKMIADAIIDVRNWA